MKLGRFIGMQATLLRHSLTVLLISSVLLGLWLWWRTMSLISSNLCLHLPLYLLMCLSLRLLYLLGRGIVRFLTGQTGRRDDLQ